MVFSVGALLPAKSEPAPMSFADLIRAAEEESARNQANTAAMLARQNDPARIAEQKKNDGAMAASLAEAAKADEASKAATQALKEYQDTHVFRDPASRRNLVYSPPAVIDLKANQGATKHLPAYDKDTGELAGYFVMDNYDEAAGSKYGGVADFRKALGQYGQKVSDTPLIGQAGPGFRGTFFVPLSKIDAITAPANITETPKNALADATRMGAAVVAGVAAGSMLGAFGGVGGEAVSGAAAESSFSFGDIALSAGKSAAKNAIAQLITTGDIDLEKTAIAGLAGGAASLAPTVDSPFPSYVNAGLINAGVTAIAGGDAKQIAVGGLIGAGGSILNDTLTKDLGLSPEVSRAAVSAAAAAAQGQDPLLAGIGSYADSTISGLINSPATTDLSNIGVNGSLDDQPNGGYDLPGAEEFSFGDLTSPVNLDYDYRPTTQPEDAVTPVNMDYDYRPTTQPEDVVTPVNLDYDDRPGEEITGPEYRIPGEEVVEPPEDPNILGLRQMGQDMGLGGDELQKFIDSGGTIVPDRFNTPVVAPTQTPEATPTTPVSLGPLVGATVRAALKDEPAVREPTAVVPAPAPVATTRQGQDLSGFSFSDVTLQYRPAGRLPSLSTRG